MPDPSPPPLHSAHLRASVLSRKPGPLHVSILPPEIPFWSFPHGELWPSLQHLAANIGGANSISPSWDTFLSISPPCRCTAPPPPPPPSLCPEHKVQHRLGHKKYLGMNKALRVDKGCRCDHRRLQMLSLGKKRSKSL